MQSALAWDIGVVAWSSSRLEKAEEGKEEIPGWLIKDVKVKRCLDAEDDRRNRRVIDDAVRISQWRLCNKGAQSMYQKRQKCNEGRAQSMLGS